MKHFFSVLLLCALSSCASAIEDISEVRPELQRWFSAAKGDRAIVEAKLKRFKPLSAAELARVSKVVWSDYAAAARKLGWNKKLMATPPTLEQLRAMKASKRPTIRPSTLSAYGKNMPYIILARGKKPKQGWPLFISMHGGGKFYGKGKVGPHGWEVNSREWKTQMKLFQYIFKPAGLYFIPRMADDNMGRWFHKHNIEIFSEMIRHAILFNGVDPNRIYIMGISQGGYGTCHLAPFMADTFAAAGSMAGGMNTVTENLRNLPFRSDIGEHDTAYKRIKLASELHAAIDAHKKKDPGAYKNVLAIQKGKGHGIDYSLSPKWLSRHKRDPHPDKIVWRCFAKDGLYRQHFYWLSLSEVPKKGEFKITAEVDRKNNKIILSAQETMPAATKGGNSTLKSLMSADLIVKLNDKLLDLDKPITIMLNGEVVFTGRVKRELLTMMNNLAERGDPYYAFPAQVRIKLKK